MAQSINAKCIQKKSKFKGQAKTAQKTDLKYRDIEFNDENHKDRHFSWGKVLEHASAKEGDQRRT